MVKKLNVLLIVGLSLLNFASHSKEINSDQESVKEIANEMINLNMSLDSLTTTVSKLFPKKGYLLCIFLNSQAIY